jgi:hypothetical protein
MCSIIGSTSVERIKELAELNAYRGQHSYSIAVFELYAGYIQYLHRGMGELDYSLLKDLPPGYIVVHQQAPTTDNKDIDSVHPAQLGKHLLWHNGIIKAEQIKKLQSELESTISWDTKLLLLSLAIYDVEGANNIDGTFSCVWHDGTNLILFRNEISPMFIDSSWTISSTKFEGSQEVPPNIMWLLEPLNPILLESSIGHFNTVENPYFFMDEQQ